MNILLVDNGSSYLPHLKRALPPAHIINMPFDELEPSFAGQVDLVVLSGGHKFSVISHARRYSRELDMIRHSSTPLIGICLGLELVVVAFGGELKFLRRKVHDDVNIRVVGHDALMREHGEYRVFESHRSAIKQLPRTLVPLARSHYGVEVIRHSARPVYAFQFHPEMTNPGPAHTLIRHAAEILVA
jgi:anthranilate synthase component II